MRLHFSKYLITALVLFAFDASAQSLAPKAKQIEDLRMSLSPNVSSDDQYPKFSVANKTLCEILKKSPALKIESSQEQTEYLDQVLILTARLLKIDSGKIIMDCFSPYYEKNEKVITAQVKSWKSKESLYLDAKNILEENLRLLKSSSDGKSDSDDEKELSLEE